MSLTRRQLIRVLGGAAALAAIPGCGDNTVPGPFSAAQRRALGAFADVILPPDDEPGGQQLGAVAFIERLLAAFDADPPAIFADGPFSGRTAFPDGRVPDNDFARFTELDRVTEAAWRLRILGTAPDGSQVPSLFDQIAAGLDAAIAVHGADLDELSPETLAGVFDAQDDAWKALLIELVSEAAFAAPEYGGNADLAGWRICHFEGDSQPLGYSRFDGARYVERPGSPLSTANPGPDPAPIDREVDDLMKIVVAFLGGRVAP
jgi:hypothetical protein